ncbi:hypothetical protein GA0074692_5842 [Micromonospora pallida]|uniref:Uncharacterized protein n=1 Tax=Micromonospora pallida TaxID=145854 RepID=A0A1C6TGD3_9ACTN|nr:hypothetical protein GA0074692_5842 [Micromonospora pallida]
MRPFVGRGSGRRLDGKIRRQQYTVRRKFSHPAVPRKTPPEIDTPARLGGSARRHRIGTYRRGRVPPGGQPFSPLRDTPWMMCRWARTKSASTGTLASTAPAMITG